MANHSYVEFIGDAMPDDVESSLRDISRRRFRGKVVVQRSPELAKAWQAKVAWWVHLPGTSPNTPMQPEDYGFACWMKVDDVVEFRHPFDGWTRWAMDVFQQYLAQELGAFIRDDAVSGVEAPHPYQYKKSYRQYLSRNFKKPLSVEDRQYLNRRMDSAPPPFKLLYKGV
jgi:hypothetical protein